MRASDEAGRIKLALIYQQLDKDDFGIAHILNTLKVMVEDA